MIKLAVDQIENWVTVTGTVRSGTTFVGKVLSMPLQVDYIHEPFGRGCGIPGFEHMSSKYIRPNPEPSDAQFYRAYMEQLLHYDFTLKRKRSQLDSWARKTVKTFIGGRGPFYLQLAKINPFHTAAVIKDPNVKFLAEYLYVHFDVKPVIVVKHPVSLVASLRRVNWWPGLGVVAEQPHLVDDYFRDDRGFLDQDWSDPVRGAAAHWRATYKVLFAQAAKYPDWQVVTLEELSRSPRDTFRRLYDALGLPWSKSVARRIDKLTRNNGSAMASNGKVQDFRRNSADIFKVSRNSIPLEERRAIFEVVQDVALQIYSRDSFAVD